MTSARESWFANAGQCAGESGSVALGSSPASFAAPVSGVLYLSGGTVTGLSLVRGGASLALGIINGAVKLRRRDSATITYLAAPTAVWVPD